jgi:predicted GNAT family acetyltransferase
MSETTSSEITVVDAPERHRFEIHVDGVRAGFTQYVDREGVRIFPHTVIEEEFGGRGLATTLVRQALDATRAAGLPVIPQCPVVRSFIAKHPEYVDLVPEAVRGDFGLA